MTFADLVIQTKGTPTSPPQVLPFVPNPVQEKYLDAVCPGWRGGDYSIQGLREQILKARQEGFSTVIAALLFVNTYNRANTNTVVIADDMDNSENLFKKVRLMYDELPEAKKLPTDYAGKRILSWPALRSTFQVLTAGKKAAGRSRTIHYLHMSERPFWPDSEILTGLLPTVPASGAIFDESTANGEGNQYHEDYKRAKAGLSTFTARFYAWFENPEYRLDPPLDFTRIGAVDGSPADLLERFGDEEELAERFGLDDSQIYWRRRKMMEPGQGPLFRQEYPSDDVEAFLVSGARFFEDWDPAKHVIAPFDIPAHWTWVAGDDWGFAAPFCFLLGAVDDKNNVVVVDEIYEPGLTNDEQALAVEAKLKQYGLKTPTGWRLPYGVAADSSMWYIKRKETGQGYADVEAFHARGLPFVPAVKNDQGAWNNVRQYLAVPEGAPPRVRVFRGRCPNLIRTMPMMKRDPRHPERMAEEWEGKPVEDHAPATLSYLLNNHLQPAMSAAQHTQQAREAEIEKLDRLMGAPEPESYW